MGRRKKNSMASGGGGYSLADLKRLFDEKAEQVESLQSQRAELQASLDAVDAAIAASMGDASATRPAGKRGPGRPPSAKGPAVKATRMGRKGKRGPRGEGGLQNMIRNVLGASSEPMKLAAIADKVLEAGYQTASTRFAVIVGQRLSEMDDVKKAGRGLYTLKG